MQLDFMLSAHSDEALSEKREVVVLCFFSVWSRDGMGSVLTKVCVWVWGKEGRGVSMSEFLSESRSAVFYIAHQRLSISVKTEEPFMSGTASFPPGSHTQSDILFPSPALGWRKRNKTAGSFQLKSRGRATNNPFLFPFLGLIEKQNKTQICRLRSNLRFELSGGGSFLCLHIFCKEAHNRFSNLYLPLIAQHKFFFSILNVRCLCLIYCQI